MKKQLVYLFIPLLGMAVSCSDDDNEEEVNNVDTQQEILADVAGNVCEASYAEMYNKGVLLQTSVATLVATSTDANLASSQQAWRDMRVVWERSEAWLFGPVEADNIDPRIDTWPVEFNDLDKILANNEELTEDYINGLDDALKGFHPIEYLLWGKDGNKKASDLTAREKAYLTALVANLVSLSKDAKDTWESGYTKQLATAGNGSAEFATRKAAYLQLVDGMQGICDEVANSKIKEPFDAADPSQEESPFAKNSFTDFKNNIDGILLMYQGKFTKDGKGLEDLVRANNLALDTDIKSKHAAAIAALEAFGNVPFGTAITTRPTDVQNAMDKINALSDALNTQLRELVQKVVL